MRSHPSPLRRGAALAAALSALLALAACAADPALAPKETLPDPAALAARLQLAPPGADTAPLPSTTWWTAYGDAELDRWIELGLRDSPSLRQAAARVAQARAGFEVARAAQLPSVGFGADIDQQRISSNGIFPPPLAGMVGTVDDIGLSGQFDLDLFGRLAARSDAARISAEAATIDGEQVRVRLAGAIAHAYFELAHAQQTVRILQDLEVDRSHLLDLVGQRVRAGFDTQVERRLAEIPVPQIRVEIERAAEQVTLARHALAVLAGQPPKAAAGVEARLPPAAASAPPEALPADLLARRADIAAAQLRVRATLREVDAARAAFYPNVNLTALVGLDALGLANVFKWPSRVWQLEPALHLPIFEGGALRAGLRGASAQTDEAIAAYNATVLQAAGEVADDLSSLASVQRQRELQHEATHSAQAAYELAGIRYQAGLGNLLSVLTAQSSELAQERAQVDLDARSAALGVSLALALGGGWQAPARVAAAR
jgi:NodT family efflux transporter outer membrane factor (OMF) lipoprotein